MYVTMRLYVPYDNDLIALREYYGCHFGQMISNVLYSALSGKKYTIHFPEDVDLSGRIFHAGGIRMNICIEDKTVEDYLRSVRMHTKSNVIKSLVRRSFDRFPLEIFAEDGQNNIRKTAGVPSWEDEKTDEMHLEKKTIEEKYMKPSEQSETPRLLMKENEEADERGNDTDDIEYLDDDDGDEIFESLI